jgi:hypothetical protein
MGPVLPASVIGSYGLPSWFSLARFRWQPLLVRGFARSGHADHDR